MKPKITGENEERVGLSVIDTNDVEHLIEMEFDGEIKYHEQDGYPDDPSKRTDRGNEMVNQARKYARWHVYRERGYDTLGARNPDRIAATLLTVYGLYEGELEARFGPLYRQIRSVFDAGVQDPVDLEPGVEDDLAVVYMQDVELGVELDGIRGLAEEYADEIGEIATGMTAPLDSFPTPTTTLGDLLGVGTGATDRGETGEGAADPDDTEGEEVDVTVPEYGIDVTSNLYYKHYPRNADPRTVRDGPDPDRSPDARIELLPTPVPSYELFHRILVRHLTCQLRDVYLGAGVDPPDPFRVVGPGFHDYLSKYHRYELYHEYHNPLADVPGYRL